MPSFKGKIPRHVALPIAEDLLAALDSKGFTPKLCGSLRRKCPVIGDIDIACAGPISAAVSTIVEGVDREVTVLTNMERAQKAATLLIDGTQLNLYVAEYGAFGAMVLFLTGNQIFNVVIRKLAKKQGYKLNQYGLWHGAELLAAKTERQIFDALGVRYLTPEERTLNYGARLAML